MRALTAFGPLLGLTAILAFFEGVYALLGESAPDAVDFLSRLSGSLFTLNWLLLDARRRGRVPCHDFGFLVLLFFPISLAWYLIWTRGLRGLLLLAVFATLLIAPPICARVLWFLRFGFAP